MTLQFSIIGYAVIALFYFACAGLLLTLWFDRGRFRWVRPMLVVVVPIVLVLPWAEEVWIAWNFANLCEGAGVHVKQKIEVDGFFNATTTGPARPEIITDPQRIASYESKGFRFVERKAGYGPDAKVSHVEKNGDGQWHVTILEVPQARYYYRYSSPRPEVPVMWKIEKIEQQVVDSETGEIIATDKVFMRFPDTIEWQWVRFFGTGMLICRGPLDEPEKQKRIGQLFEYVFVPKE